MAGDAVSVAPDHYKVLEENDRVRILEYKGGPGTKTEMYSHPDIVAVALSDAKVRFTNPEGQSMEIDLSAGMAMYQDGSDHATENIGSSESHVILIELK